MDHDLMMKGNNLQEQGSHSNHNNTKLSILSINNTDDNSTITVGIQNIMIGMVTF